MALTAAVRNWWADRRCKTTGLASISHLKRGEPYTTAKVLVQPETVELWAVHEAVLYALDYGDAEIVGSIRHCPGGIGGRVCEPSGKNCSLHNYCLALDIDPYARGNGYIRARVTEEDFDEDWFPAVCKFTLEQVQAIEAIRMNDGTQPFKWLGWAIGDFMHWQINISPASVATGINYDTVVGKEGDMANNLKLGDEGNLVTWYQKSLNGWYLYYDSESEKLIEVTTIFDEATEAAVKDYQEAAQVEQTGVIGGAIAPVLSRFNPYYDEVNNAVDQPARNAAQLAHDRLDGLHDI